MSPSSFPAPLESIANPQSTPLHTVAPWYFYWLQGLLKIADKTIAGVYIPGILLVLLMAIPYLDRNPSRRGRDRRVAIISGVVAGFVMIVLSWMGTPYYAVQGAPAVEIVQELMPEEGMGPVREMGYAHLPDRRLRHARQTPRVATPNSTTSCMSYARPSRSSARRTRPSMNHTGS